MSEFERHLICPVCGHTATDDSIGAVYCGPHGTPAHIPAARMILDKRTKQPADELEALLREEGK